MSFFPYSDSQITDIYSCDLAACSPPTTYGLLQKVSYLLLRFALVPPIQLAIQHYHLKLASITLIILSLWWSTVISELLLESYFFSALLFALENLSMLTYLLLFCFWSGSLSISSKQSKIESTLLSCNTLLIQIYPVVNFFRINQVFNLWLIFFLQLS